jgi:hypothetical protein
MKTLRSVLFAAVGFVILICALVLGGLQPQEVQSGDYKDVMVVNTPLPVTGTITGSPTVNAQQSGAWDVGITGTPNVNVANTPNVGITGTPTVNAQQSGSWSVDATIPHASRAVTITHPSGGLPNQSTQNFNLTPPLTTSLVTVANLGGTGHRSFLVVAYVSGGGHFSFSAKEGLEDVILPLVQPIPITRISIRCDSFSTVVCGYEISLVGN